MKTIFAARPFILLLSLLLLDGGLARPAATQEPSDAERGAKNKALLLGRLKHSSPEFRGDKPGEMRLKWEWYSHEAGDYVYQKQLLVAQLSRFEKHLLRQGWVYQDMKVTFQEIFAIDASLDDVLVPVLAHGGLLAMAPDDTFAGLILLGKKGEEKGAITRKYTERYVDRNGGVKYCDKIEFRNEKGELETAGSFFSNDAFNLRWRDIKDRVADDASRIHAFEDVGFQCGQG